MANVPISAFARTSNFKGQESNGIIETRRAILVVSGQVDLRSFGEWGQKAITYKAYIRFPYKHGRGSEPPKAPPLVAPLFFIR